MTSPAQILANTKNALFSSGPRTPQGKETSSRNATTHALTGDFRVLAHEDQPEFDTMLATYRAELKPCGEHQGFLVELMVQARWEIRRCNRLMSEVVQRMSKAEGAPSSPNAVIADALLARTADAFLTLKRYAAAAERTYLRCHRELMQTRKQEAVRMFDEEWRHNAAPRVPASSAVPNEPNKVAHAAAATAKPAPGVPFTDKDPLSWRL